MLLSEYKYDPVPGCRPGLDNPSLIVMHWTAGPSADSAINWWKRPNANTSAHFVIDRDGTVIQTVDLHCQAFHAGVSEWDGRPDCNRYSIGVEMVNWGPVLPTPSASVFRSESGAKVAGSTCVKVGGKWYQAYTASQWDALRTLVLRLQSLFPSIKEVVGHSDIAPGRKIDPGPAFPMRGLRSVFEGRQ